MNKFISALIISIAVSICAVCYTQSKNSEFENSLVRLHIVANSDSEEDQRVKLLVRDEILKTVDASDEYFLEKAQICANRVLEKSGMPYRAGARCGRFYFPEKEYNGITLPNGEYFGLKILLGEGQGKNWWCILYPPVCTSTDVDKERLKKDMSADTYDIISGKNSSAVVKLRVVEIVNGISHKLKQ